MGPQLSITNIQYIIINNYEQLLQLLQQQSLQMSTINEGLLDLVRISIIEAFFLV